jgi:hypothetical protein
MTKDEALDLALEALKNVTVTGPDDDGLVWINLPGNGTTGKAILRVGKAGLIAAQCAKLYEEQRTKAITAIKQARALDKKAENARELGLDYEPVAWTNWRELAGARHYRTPGWEMYADKRNPDDVAIYTFPPTQKKPDAFDCGVYLGKGKDHAIKHHVSYQPAPVQEPVDTLIAAWQALEETSGHVLDVGDAEGRMHMSVIRSAWEQMDSLVREMWDERGRP